jgi:hypothetical protein
MASNYGPPPVRGPCHELLAQFAGRWRAEGTSYGRNQNPDRPRDHPEPWVSTETTVWHAGGFFLVVDEVAKVGEEALVTHAVIGFDQAADAYVAHAFENHGHYRRYAVRNDGRTWTWSSSTERARIEFSEDGRSQDVRWEWRPFGDRWCLCANGSTAALTKRGERR